MNETTLKILSKVAREGARQAGIEAAFEKKSGLAGYTSPNATIQVKKSAGGAQAVGRKPNLPGLPEVTEEPRPVSAAAAFAGMQGGTDPRSVLADFLAAGDTSAYNTAKAEFDALAGAEAKQKAAQRKAAAQNPYGGAQAIADAMQVKANALDARAASVEDARKSLEKRIAAFRAGQGTDTEEALNREIAVLGMRINNYNKDLAEFHTEYGEYSRIVEEGIAAVDARLEKQRAAAEKEQRDREVYYSDAHAEMLERQIDDAYTRHMAQAAAERDGKSLPGSRQASELWDEYKAAKDRYTAWETERAEYDLSRLDRSEQQLLTQYVAAKNGQSTSGGHGVTGGYYTGDEVQKRLQAVVDHFGAAEAERLIAIKERAYNAKQQQERDAEMAEYASRGAGQAIAASLASIATQALSGIPAAISTIGQKLHNPGGFATLDTNTAGFSMLHATESLRGGTERGIMPDEKNATWGQKTGVMLYRTLMSGIDSYLASFLPGKLGGAALAVNAASSTIRDVTERGGTIDQAIVSGIAAGVFEDLFENVSIGNLKALRTADVTKTGRDVALNITKSAVTNASEEGATEIANILFDTLTLGNISNVQIRMRELMAKNVSEEDAKRQVACELGGQIGESALSGLLMGVAFGGIESIAGLAKYKKRKSANESIAETMNALSEVKDTGYIRVNPDTAELEFIPGMKPATLQLSEQGVPDATIAGARELLADIRTAYGDGVDAARVVQQEIVNFENDGNMPAARALAALYEETQRENTVDAEITQPTAGEAMDREWSQSEDIQYSLEEIDGRIMPVIDTKNDTRKFDAAETYLKTLIDTQNPFATILSDAHPVYIGKDLPREYKSSEYTKGMDSALRTAKMQAATNLDEMLLLAENGEWRENVKAKHNKDAANGWYRYDTEFAIPGKNIKGEAYNAIFSGTLLIRNDADGKSYLYDLLDIQEKKTVAAPTSSTAGTRSEVSERAHSSSIERSSTAPSSDTAKMQSELNESIRSSSAPMLTQDDTGVNPSIRIRNETDTLAGPQGLTKPTAEDTMDREWSQSKDDAQFSIMQIPNTNKYYVKSDQKVITGDDPAKWGKQVENFINKEVRAGRDVNIPTIDGDIVTITPRTAYKMGDDTARVEKDGNRIKMSAETFRIKAEAAGHIDELMLIAQYDGYKNDINNKHENDFAEDGFNYWEAFFEDSDGGYYRIKISVGLSGDGKTVYNINDIQKRSPFPPTALPQNGALMEAGASSASPETKAPGTSYAPSVSQNAPRVNPSIRIRNETDTLDGPQGLTKPTAEDTMDREWSQSEDIQYSLEKIDGRIMPVIDTKNDTRKFDAAETYLKTLIDAQNPFATILSDAHPVYIGKDLPGEYLRSKYTEKMRSSLREVKRQAATNLDEMLLLAENGEWRENVKAKHNKDAANGWYRYDTEFAVPIPNLRGEFHHYNIYEGTLLIRNDEEGRSYLYDLIDVNEKKKTIPSPSSTAGKRSEIFEAMPSSPPMLTQQSTGVNPSTRIRNETDTLDADKIGDTENKTIGGADYAGQETETGAGRTGNLSDGGGERDAGERAGRQIGKLAETAGRNQKRNVQARRAVERQNRVHALRLEKVSTESLGIRAGSEAETVTVIPEEAYDREMMATRERVERESGKKAVFILGRLRLETERGVKYAQGANTGDAVYIQADNSRYTVEQIAEHELFHEKARGNRGLVSAIHDRILEMFDQEEFQKVVERYMNAYDGMYQGDDLLQKIVEEIFADAYAGMNSFSDAAVEQYREVVQQEVDRRTGRKAARSPQAETRAGPDSARDGMPEVDTVFTEDTEDSFSIGETEDGRAVAVVDSDILSHIDTTVWDKTKKAQAKKTAKTALLAFKDGVQVNEITYKVSKISRNEFTRSNDAERLYRKDPKIFADKLRASANADDIIIATTSWANDGMLTHPRTDNLVDFTHGKVLIQAGNNQYEAETVVGITDAGEYVFYDVVDMEPSSFKLKEEPSTAATDKDAESAIQESSSADSITENGLPVKGAFILPEQTAGVPSDEQFFSASGYTPDSPAAEANERWNEIRATFGRALERDAEAQRVIERLRREGELETADVLERLWRADPETFAPDMLYDDRGERWDGTLRTIGEREAEAKPEEPNRFEKLRQQAVAPREERLRMVPREEFRATPAIDRLGIHIEGSVADYAGAESLRKNDQAARELRRDIERETKRLKATAAESSIATNIAAGVLTEEDIPHTMNPDRIMDLAELYGNVRALGYDMIAERRRDINWTLDEMMDDLFRDADKYNTSSAISLYHNTPQRNMRRIFGDKLGKRINREIFDPVARNEAERLRFVNRQFDAVRAFEDSKGRLRALSREESALVQQVMEGRALEEQVASMEMGGAIRDAAEDLRHGGSIDDTAREHQLDLSDRRTAQRYAGWLDAQDALQSGKVDKVKIENAVRAYQERFNDYYDAINDFLVVHGYAPIGFIKGYAPHMQSDDSKNILNKALQALGVQTGVESLPTSIAGITSEFKPSKKWNPYFLERTTDQTDYDIQAAFESYVSYMSDVLYHTDDIMRVRRMVRHFRKTYSRDDIRNSIEWAEGLRFATNEEKEEFLRAERRLDYGSAPSVNDIEKAMDAYIEEQYSHIENMTKYGDMASWLDNYANILAGKQSIADRGFEAEYGRKSLNLGLKVTRAFACAQVAGNISSALNQTAQLPIIFAENGMGNTLRAMGDIAFGKLRRAGFAEESDLLTGKQGIRFLVHTPGEMVTTAMFKPAEFVDGFVSTLAVRGAYLKAVRRGMNHADAMRAADQYGVEVMASRLKGMKPTAFESKNTLSQIVHMFQVEAVNSWEHIVRDLPRDFRELAETKGRGKAALAMSGVIVKALLAAFLLNRVNDELYGGTPAPFDLLGLTANFVASGNGLSTNEYLRRMIDDVWEDFAGERLFDTERMERGKAFDWGSAVGDLWYNVSNDIPFVRNVSGLLGWGDQTIPMPDLFGKGADVKNAVSNAGIFSEETGEALLGLAAEFLPGGRQITKTSQGVKTMRKGGRVYGYGENERLQYPVEDTALNWIRAVLFGNAGLTETNAFYASGLSGLSKEQTAVYRALVEKGADSGEVYDTIQAMSAAEKPREKRDVLTASNLTDRQKAKLYSGIIGESRDEDFAMLMQGGMSWAKIMDAYNRYAELQAEEGTTATEKATEFARWLDGQPYTEKQKTRLAGSFVYFSMAPAEAGQYAKMTDAGLSDDDAYDLVNTLSALTPEAGKKQVSDMQKYRKIAAGNLSDAEKIAAIGALMGTEMTTESGNPSQYAKMIAALDEGASLTEYLDLKEFDGVDMYLKATEVGMSSQNAVRVAEALASIPENQDGSAVSTLQKQAAAVKAVSNVKEQIKAYAVAGSRDDYDKNVERLTSLFDGSSLTPAQYVGYRQAVQGMDGKDASGETVTNLKKARVLMAINKLTGLSKAQKDALYLDAGYSAKEIGKALWNSGRSYQTAEAYAKVL